MFNKITIIGLGLIGGSLAGALKKNSGVKNVTGIDTSTDTVGYAIQNDIIDEGFDTIDRNIADSDLVVIAVYVEKIPEIASQLCDIITDKTVVTDVGSVKGSLIKEIENLPGKKFDFIGAHPISGTENSGIRSADPRLFVNKKCILTPTESSRNSSVKTVEELWKLCGSEVLLMPPDMHDRVFSFVSHLPHLVAYSLINTVADSSEQGLNFFEYAGGGLNDYTRIAASSPGMWTSIFLENRKELLRSVSEFKKQIEKLENAIETEDRTLLNEIISASSAAKKTEKY